MLNAKYCVKSAPSGSVGPRLTPDSHAHTLLLFYIYANSECRANNFLFQYPNESEYINIHMYQST